jgi:hypothetical protein
MDLIASAKPQKAIVAVDSRHGASFLDDSVNLPGSLFFQDIRPRTLVIAEGGFFDSRSAS